MSNKFYLGLMLFLFLSTYTFAQVDVSGACFGGSTVNLVLSGTQDGRDIFVGTGTVAGNPNIQISVYWEPAGPGWVLAFSGQPFYLETNNTSMPNNTTVGNWVGISAPCPITDITIGGPSTLPVELTFFEGKLRDEMSHLSWQTASETNNLGFDVERSADGISWNKLGFVAGAENSSEILDYQFVDVKPALGFNYYRLRQVDIDGVFEYSDIIKIEKEKKVETIIVFPNPVKNKLNIVGSNFVDAQVSIYNELGKLVKEITTNTENVKLDISAFQKGIYIIEIRKENLVFVEKFVKI